MRLSRNWKVRSNIRLPLSGRTHNPPSPARMVPQPVSLWRIELGVSGSSVVPTMPRFYLLSPPSLDEPGKPPSSEAGVTRRRYTVRGTDRAGPSVWDYAAAVVLRVRVVGRAECFER